MSKPLILKHDEKLKQELIRVGIANNYTVKSSEDRQEFQLKYDTVRHSIGSGLTLNPDGGIVIGDNINAILVNLHVYFYSGSKTDERKSLFIRRNQGSTNNAPGTMTARLEYNIAQTTLETSAIIPVQKGDIITIGIIASKGDTIQNTSTNNFLDIVKLS